jgi:hypothetical protein
MRVAIASVAWMPEGFTDNRLLGAELARQGAEATEIAWDDPGAEWHAHDLVVIRSTWDYAARRDEFVAWAERVGDRLHNPPEVIRWNTDKRYLADLDATGFPVVETHYVEPGDEAPPLEGEVVVKPTVSAGGRDTGRFAPDAHGLARDLIAELGGAGRTVMVQPYLGSVDAEGETAIVLIDGEVSHTLRKRAVLAPDEVAPTRDDELGAAEAMYDPTLVTADGARPDEVELAHEIVTDLRRRFGATPLIARVDLLRGPDGHPVLLELEAVEPNLYLEQAPGAVGRLAAAILRRVRGR